MTAKNRQQEGQQANNKYCMLYLVRHGETDWNVKGLVQGRADIPLNEKGEAQARNLAKKLRHIKFAAVFSSDLLRAKRTAEIVAMEKKLTVITKKVLRERDFGEFEGKPNPWLESWRKMLRVGIENLAEKERGELLKVHGGVETDEQLMNRFVPFLREVALAYSGKNVLIVTHGSVLRTFLLRIGFFKDELDSFKATISNASYVKVLSDGVEFFVKETEGIEKIKY